MGSQGGGSGCSVMQAVKSQALGHQASLYGLTLGEVQKQLGHLGKPLGTMNLDELLESVRSTEPNQDPTPGVVGQPLSKDLSKKTVEEVWRDIQLQVNKKRKTGAEDHLRKGNTCEEDREPAALGEITLEDFLSKAGVTVELPPIVQSGNLTLGLGSACSVPQPDIPQCIQWMQCQYQPLVQQPPNSMTSLVGGDHMVQPPRIAVAANPAVDAIYLDTQITMSPSALISTLSDVQTPGHKMVAPGEVIEKTVERRQKRMIKNRESAARSRARRQAYTHELENKVQQLEEENARLRRQREVEQMFPCTPPAEPKGRLRRTNSAPILTAPHLQ